MKKSPLNAMTALSLAMAALPAIGMPPVQAAEAAGTMLKAPPQVELPAPIVTRHQGVFNGRKLDYSAMVERFDTTMADGSPAARLVAISYIMKSAVKKVDGASRPVVFAFNGGPISSSSTLHMGALGPKRVAVPDDIQASPSTFRLVDNPNALLDVADLVFFDPAGTGFSRFALGVDPKSQASNVTDSRQLAQMILQWRKGHGREGAPIYLLGESYGTIRAPEAARQLLEQGVAVDGVILLGQAVNIIEYAQRPANLVSYAASLPTLAAIAWELGKADARGRTFDAFVADARDFAATDYLSTLYLGGAAPMDRQRVVAARLAEFTGLPADWYLANRLRISKVDYQQKIRPGFVLNTNDARYAKPVGGTDPFDSVMDTYVTNFKSYLANDLKAGTIGDYLSYFQFPGGLNGWDWGVNKSPFGDWPYQKPISALMERNPRFRLLVGNGWTDTQTTVGAMELLVNEAQWPKDRVRTATYRGGHMSYTIDASQKAFADDVRAMIRRDW